MLAIGRALMTHPRLMLIDEMSAGLSPVVTQELLARLRRINDELGTVMLIVEQSPHRVDVVGERLYLLEQGSVVASGTFGAIGGADAIAELYLGVGRRTPSGRVTSCRNCSTTPTKSSGDSVNGAWPRPCQTWTTH
jgi:branched-chain amino acid transport system ATP-binding protein